MLSLCRNHSTFRQITLLRQNNVVSVRYQYILLLLSYKINSGHRLVCSLVQFYSSGLLVIYRLRYKPMIVPSSILKVTHT